MPKYDDQHGGGYVLHSTRLGSAMVFAVILLVISFLSTVWTSLTFCPEETFAWVLSPTLDFSDGPLKSVLYSVPYCTFVLSLQLVTGSWLLRRLRARSVKTALLFVLVQVIAGFAALWAAMLLELAMIERDFDLYKTLILGLITFMFSLLFSGYMYMVKVNRELATARQTAQHSELTALRAQINPHFLFNALNSIAALIRLRPNEAEDVTEHLADLFRYSLRASDRSLVSLADELYAVELYLNIEESRFRDRLSIEWAVPRDIRRASIPSLSLQPLVENSIKHGLNKSEGSCTVAVSAHRIEDKVSIVVADTGPGFQTTDLDAVFVKGTGLSNVHRRLQLEFGSEAELRIQRHHVELIFPYVELSGRSAVRPEGALQPLSSTYGKINST